VYISSGAKREGQLEKKPSIGKRFKQVFKMGRNKEPAEAGSEATAGQ
jgi:hypothetical protein